MNDTLVAYFSASGQTKRLAETIAEVADADIVEIEPAKKYSPADLDYMDKTSRSTIEMNDKTFRPELKNPIDTEKYQTIFVGFPIWWYESPRIIQTFLESQDLSGKTLIPFATSGSSGISGAEDVLKHSAERAEWKPGKRLRPDTDTVTIKKWIEELDV